MKQKRVFSTVIISLVSAIFVHSCSGSSIKAHGAQDSLKHSNVMKDSPPSKNSIAWFNAESPGKRKGVALVVHGLNFRPDKMESIISLLNRTGIDVLNLSLQGHGQNFIPIPFKQEKKARLESFKQVSYGLWINEIFRAYHHARKKCLEQNIPLLFVGYSLGGVLGADLLSSYPEVQFDKMVLLAPAIRLHTLHYIAKLLSPFPRLAIPSLSSKEYLTNNATPMAAYNALFETIEHLKNSAGSKLNVPTLVLIDPRDELVSHRKIKRFVENKGLDQWRVHPVNKDKASATIKMHHYIIDESSVGEKPWRRMEERIIEHLLP